MTDLEREALSLVNNTRIDHDLKPLRRAGLLTLYARHHSRKMARSGDLYHGNVEAMLQRKRIPWAWWGENAGVTSGGVLGLHKAYLASPPHKANILGRFKRVGIGCVRDDDGILWQTTVFLR